MKYILILIFLVTLASCNTNKQINANEKNKTQNFLNNERTILITPTYGKNNLLEKCGIELIEILLNAGFKVILRPHFRIFLESSSLIDKIEKKFKDDKNFSLEKGVIPFELFQNSLCLITDWSGISFEYAFVFEKPVMFIDLPQKIINSSYEELGIESIEIKYREQIGIIIPIHNLERILEFLNSFDKQKNINIIKNTRSSLIFNLGNSKVIGANYIQNLIS